MKIGLIGIKNNKTSDNNGSTSSLQRLVKEKSGLDYLQVYVHEDTGQKLFFIDQLNQEMIASGGYEPEHNHCTLMLSEEY